MTERNEQSERNDPCIDLRRRTVLGAIGTGLTLTGLPAIESDRARAAASVEPDPNPTSVPYQNQILDVTHSGYTNVAGVQFWERTRIANDDGYQKTQRSRASDWMEEGIVPMMTYTRWNSLYNSTINDLSSATDAEAAWAKWLRDRKQYWARGPEGEFHTPWNDEYPTAWVAPSMPLDEADWPDGTTDADFGDLIAEKVAGKAHAEGTRGVTLADGYGGLIRPGSAYADFNSRIIADFEQRMGVTLAGSDTSAKSDDIIANHREAWHDYWCHVWGEWQAKMANAIEAKTGDSALIRQQGDRSVAHQRGSGNDLRIWLEYLDADQLLYYAEANAFGPHDPRGMGRTLYLGGQFPAYEPDAQVGIRVTIPKTPQESFDRSSLFYSTADNLMGSLSDAALQEWGEKYRKWHLLGPTWLGVANRDGSVRRGTQSILRYRADTGHVPAELERLIENHRFSAPFGLAAYYTDSIARSVERDGEFWFAASNELEARIDDDGWPIGYFVSDAAIDDLDEANYPTGWALSDPERLPDAERRKLEEIAPIHDTGEPGAVPGTSPLSFSDNAGGFAFVDQNGDTILLVYRRDWDDPDATTEQVTVSFDGLSSGSYTATDLLNDDSFGVDIAADGTGTLTFELERWDARMFESDLPRPTGGDGGDGDTGVPSPWTAEDVGNPSAGGSASESGGSFAVEGAGSDIWDSSDEFQFVHQSLSGDGSLVAKVESQEATDDWAKAGVMIRESLSADAKHAMSVVTPGNGTSFQRRPSTGSSSNHTTPGDGASAPHWVKIERSGDLFTGYESADGSSWTEIGSATLSMASDARVGLAVTSHDAGTRSTVEFSDVSVAEGSAGSTVYQAEDATLGGGTTLDSDHGGYNGSGFANFPTSGGTVEWSAVEASGSGTVELTFRYALDDESRTIELTVDGATQSVTFDGTGGWSSWDTTTVSASVESGQNTVALESTGQDGPNLDQMATAGRPSGGNGSTIGEVGLASNDTGGSDAWNSLSFVNEYDDPVVAMGPPSYNGSQPTTLRARNVSSGSIEYQLDEWEYLDGRHASEEVPFAVVESGRHTLSDGASLEASQRQVKHNWRSVTFSEAFEGTPTVLVNRTSTNYEKAAVPRVRNVTNRGFEVRLQKEEAESDALDTTERVGWIAIERGSGDTGHSYEAGRTADTVTDAWHTIEFDGSYSETVFLASPQTADGGDPMTLRHRDLGSESVDVFCEEARSNDSETGHTTEQVGYAVFGGSGDVTGE